TLETLVIPPHLPGVSPEDIMKYSRWLIALCFLFAVPLARAADAPKPVRLLAEAEDFRVEKGPWKILPYRENYYAPTFAVSSLSALACVGAPAQTEPGQEAVASQVVQIPGDGNYQVLARYEQPFNFPAEFTVAIEQKGKEVYR